LHANIGKILELAVRSWKFFYLVFDKLIPTTE